MLLSALNLEDFVVTPRTADDPINDVAREAARFYRERGFEVNDDDQPAFIARSEHLSLTVLISSSRLSDPGIQVSVL